MSKKKSGKKSIIKRIFGAIGRFFAKITKPIRDNKVWKFLRRTILRSPFRGYFVESFKELRHVTWPSRGRAWRLTLVVIVFAAIFAAVTSGLDYGFEKLAERLFLR